MRKYFILTLSIFLVIGLSGYVGYFLGTNRVQAEWKGFKPVLNISSQLPGNASELDMQLFYQVLGHLNDEYYDKSKIDTQKIVYGAISGALESLGDPYTSFFPPSASKEFKEQLAGEFSGIGAELGMNDDSLVSIVAPLDGSPAEKAGVKSGDVILKVDDEETFGWTIAQAVEKIRGPKGSSVILTLGREGADEEQEVSITRDTIQIDSVRTWIRRLECSGDNCEELVECATCESVAYVRVSQFGDRTNNEWQEKLNEIFVKTQNDPTFAGIILDLRNNPGGYMHDAVFIASEFVEDGEIVIQEDGNGSKLEFPVSRPGSFYNTPIVVLVNRGSASASEIVTGALRDYNRATIVGETTFGKGTIQKSVDFQNGESVHITIAKWLTPNGTWVHEDGITPDVEIEYDDEDSNDEYDNQLREALDILIN